ncbi:MAG: hypothetical protein ACRDHV_01510 [Actinomycetota bacterium]
MPKAELVFANVLDNRIFEAEGEGGQPLLYTISIPGRALPFTVVRYWKAPQGYVNEWFELIAPSGKKAHASKQTVRYMPGQMDLTIVRDSVADAVLDELGVYAASFLVDGEVQGQVECQVLLSAAPQKLPKEIEDALRKSDVIWVGQEMNGRDRAVPVWFAYQQGRIYLLHTSDPGAGEQQIPGLPDAPELVVVTRHKYRDTRQGRFHAAVRLIEPDDPEWGGLAAVLADRRRDRHGPPQDAIDKWKSSCVIVELTPTIPQ